MTLSPKLPIYRTLAVALAAAFGLGMVASAAQAFTFEDQAPVNGSSSSNLNNPATSRFSTGTNNGQTTIRQGNTSLQFGGQRSFNQRYNTDGCSSRTAARVTTAEATGRHQNLLLRS